MKYLRTNEIVVPQSPYQGQQLRHLVREGTVPKLLILRDEAGATRPDIESYTRALKIRMEQIRRAAGYLLKDEVTLDQLVQVQTLPAADLRYVARDANANPAIDSILVMSPTESDYEPIVAELSPGKDVDGMNPDSGRMPCTPRAIQGALEYHGLWSSDLTYTLVGMGRTVNSRVADGLKELLGSDYEKQVNQITRSNQDELLPAMATSEVAIVAAGVRHQIRPGMIYEDTRAIVGVCIEDIHPTVYNILGDLLVTPVHRDPVNWGVGMNTANIAVQDTLDAALLRLSAQRQ